jgi:CheY-like chemotaxis protein
LLAEDDAAMRELLASQLRRAGLHVEVASSGEELRARLVSTHGEHLSPDIIVSDIRMPGWTGLEALRWLRDHRPQARVILITAFGDARTHQRARRLGAVAVFDKPFDVAELLTAVIALSSGVL